MEIGIDISLAVGQRAGVGQYSFNLVKELAKLDLENQYTLFPFFTHVYDLDFKKFDFPRGENFRMKFENLSEEWIDTLWNKLWIPKYKFLDGLDVFHSTTFCFPNDFKGKVVSTIYDVSFRTHPEFHTTANIVHCDRGTKQAVEMADVIIVISEHTKKDLIKYYNCPAEKIVITYLGYGDRFKFIDDEQKKKEVSDKYGIKKPFVFNVGSIEPRKNIVGLIKAYAGLESRHRNNFDLVISGGKGWKNSDIYKEVEKLKIGDNVKFIGYVDDDDLPYLYNSAEVFVYPSFYEGFGLPVLEAMACGCPVITSNTSSLPEVGGDAALYIDPNKIETISKALESILDSEEKKKQMIKEGFEQAKKFSWKKCAEETLVLYKQF